MKILKHLTWRRVLLVLAVIVVILQLVPVNRTNPPVVSEIAAPVEVHKVLERACYDCHSNKTRWPWYAYVAPVSWLVAKDVHDARRRLNFSEWGTYIADKQEAKIQEIWEVVSEGEMPLPIYLPMHPEAKLSDADRATLQRWAAPELP